MDGGAGDVFEIASLNNLGWIFSTCYCYLGSCEPGTAGNVSGGDEQALAQVNAIPGPPGLHRGLMNIDGIDQKRVISALRTGERDWKR